jgi:Ankyrin repeats (3 copies)/Ankyrin repeats (many copies)
MRWPDLGACRVLGAAVLLLLRSQAMLVPLAIFSGCDPPEPSKVPSDAGASARRGGPPPAPATPSASVEASAGMQDEAVIAAYRDLAEAEARHEALERFVAEHPQLLQARAEPYGDALMWVLEFAEAEAALVLIRTGASRGAGRAGRPGPLHLAARGCLDAVVAELITRGSVVDELDYWGTPLHFAAKQGCLDTTKRLLGAGADPNVAAADHQFTPLHHALLGRHVDVVSALIKAGADVDARDDDGRTALHWGAYAYRPQPLHVYKRPGQPHDTRLVDPGPATAMARLLDAGAKLQAPDDDGDSPLHEAVRGRSRRAVELLMARGADPRARNRAGQTPVSLAKERKLTAIARLLARKP